MEVTQRMKSLSGGEAALTERASRSLDRLREVMRVSDLPAGLDALAQSENAINDAVSYTHLTLPTIYSV